MHAAEVVALGYDYPTPSRVDDLKVLVDSSVRGVALRRMTDFIDQIGALALGEWEELHTSTLDLSPIFVPYVGHVQWGENYRRGEFMADLKREMKHEGVDLGGELPDHIAPVLRYLAKASEPLPDLVDVLTSAVAEMKSTLQKAAPANPYLHLLAATAAIVEDQNVLIIRGSR